MKVKIGCYGTVNIIERQILPSSRWRHLKNKKKWSNLNQDAYYKFICWRFSIKTLQNITLLLKTILLIIKFTDILIKIVMETRFTECTDIVYFWGWFGSQYIGPLIILTIQCYFKTDLLVLGIKLFELLRKNNIY